MKTRISLVIGAFTWLSGLAALFAQGTAFTYQGRFTDNGNPATGIYDFQFTLYDDIGTAQGQALTNSATTVTNGLFTVMLDFGNQFPGAGRWLEIGARTNGTSTFTILSPRQPLTPAPYAITASNLTGVVTSGQITGTMPLTQLPAVLVTNGAGSVNLAGTFGGNGTGLTNVNATTFGGLGTGNFWQLGGNNVSNGQFIGSTNNQPLEMWVNGQRAMRVEPTTNDSSHMGIVNVINGSSQNYAMQGVRGATIAGGGAANLNSLGSPNYVTGDFGTISGGFLNNCAAGSVVAGGSYNVASGTAAAIGGGTNNGSYGYGATIAGGSGNSVGVSASYSTAVGGKGNAIGYGTYDFLGGGLQNYCVEDYSALVGGVFNTNQGAFSFIGGGELNLNSGGRFSIIGGGIGNINLGWWSVIGGGDHNTNNTSYGFIGGGQANTNVGYGSLITGGAHNTSSGIYSAVGGGELNTSSALDATVSGGQANVASGNYSTVGGGQYNSATNTGATVPGGYANTAGGINSFAAGSGASAQHAGTFVWADNQPGVFVSTSTNQFLIRAQSGVGINTNNPASVALNVNGTVAASAFAGNGTALTNVNAATLNGQTANAFATAAGSVNYIQNQNVSPQVAAFSISGNATVAGVIRSGSESGTSEAPSPAGLVSRRINSTQTSTGQIVARTDTLTLERDGSNGGFLIRYSASPGMVTIACMGMDNTGTQKNFYTTLANPSSAGTVQLYADGQNIEHFECSFGITYNSGQHLTQATLSRYGSDYYWSGNLISTYNQ